MGKFLDTSYSQSLTFYLRYVKIKTLQGGNDRLIEEPSLTGIKCPKCGTENLRWRAACTNCGERLHKEDDKIKISDRDGLGSILIFVPAFIAACFFSFFVVVVAKGYPFLWAFLPVPWIVLGVAGRWKLIGGILLVLQNVVPWVAISIIMNINSGEALSAAMIFPFLVVLYHGPLLTSGIILIVLGLKKQ